LDLGKVSRIPELQGSLKMIADKVSDKTITKELANDYWIRLKIPT